MGRVFSSLSRELRSYNIENRAHEAISKEIRPPSAKYPSFKDEIKAAQDQGVPIEELMKKNEELSANLKNIYVVSSANVEEIPEKTDRQLPMDRVKDWSDLDYGYVEPKDVPPGKITLKMTLDLLSKHQEDSIGWSYDKLASHFNISNKLVEQLVDRYRVFELKITEETLKNAKSKKLDQYVQLQEALRNIRQITLLSDNKKKEEKVNSIQEIKPT